MSIADKSRMAASVRDRLLSLSKSRSEVFDQVIVRYALERFLLRLSNSAHREKLILKGAMLLQLWSDKTLRPTRDLDFLSQGETDEDVVRRVLEDICKTEAEEDGLTFDLTDLRVNQIREEDRYGGIRAKFVGRLGSARIPMQIDFGIGDAVTPAPAEIEFPSLLEMTKPNILSYPMETVIAEKLEIIVSLGMENSRMKDYFDLWFFATTLTDVAGIPEAIKRTFERREQTIPAETPIGLSDDFTSSAAKRAQWRAFKERAIGEALELADVVRIIREFAMPLLAQAREAA